MAAEAAEERISFARHHRCESAYATSGMLATATGPINLIRTTRSSNGVIEDWTDQVEPGSYTVDSDCTGTFLNKSQNLVVVDGGKRYFLLSVAPGTTVTEEGTRIEEEKKD